MTERSARDGRRVRWRDFVLAANVPRGEEVSWWYQFIAWATSAGYRGGDPREEQPGAVWVPPGLDPADLVTEWRMSRWAAAWR